MAESASNIFIGQYPFRFAKDIVVKLRLCFVNFCSVSRMR